VSSSVAGLLRLVSRVACLIVIASFVIFAVNQTGKASTHQQEELSQTPIARQAPSSHPKHENEVRKVIDEASNKLTSPFSGLTSGSSSQWVKHGVNVILALLIYGFALGFLARVLRVKV
jgi:predicted PurR-regulated permease PerM